jgi:hypothetical protein
LQCTKREWAKITSDREILDIISGTVLEFTEEPTQSVIVQKFTPKEEAFIKEEIQSLLEKGVIIHSLRSLIKLCPQFF